MLRRIIYKIKRSVQSHSRLYHFIYLLVTFNRDYIAVRLSGVRYPSRFGGLWTDKPGAEAEIQHKYARGEITAEEMAGLQQFRERGFLVTPRAIAEELIEQYLNDLARLQREDSPLLVTSIGLPEPAPYRPGIDAEYLSVRTVDDYFHIESARRLLFAKIINRWLSLLLERPPMLTQSLNFFYGSEQALHQDTAFVTMNSPMKFIGVWIALEDIEEGAGELLYIPGSHLWPDYLFSGCFKHYDAERDGLDQLHQWYDWIQNQAAEQGNAVEKFLAKKGDVLFWHAGLVHGGAPVTKPGLSRRSLVGHYCAEGVRPLYHYYKPAQRMIYTNQDQRYTSSYYS
ncbi:phytanoyl-CoA dioxygenase family protein [Halioxenophilus sp. WMMB6]|uniref:phytanoyl-CoA dioxygenase family protein n=1 Tax=Halioxenophilus sp. WMMB6 TaxID=3073815 RepID=UPI00295EC677|nr:phytanoyl-CoA dioxygenase family protein [Halioxenophilus sp. WMMB6]